jgi:CelD/BcsL family acetyltransferase involved in cellulose biosynthesis
MAGFYLRSLDELRQPWNEIYTRSGGDLLFSSQDWAETWWKHFGGGSSLYAGSVEEDGRAIGIAPLRMKEGTVCFIGSDNLFDFQDFIIDRGCDEVFYRTLLHHLSEIKAAKLDLGLLLPDSSVHRSLLPLARESGLAATCDQEDVTVALDLPHDEAAYLALLSGKQRHELLRKERRLNEEGDISYRVDDSADDAEINLFLRFFRESREDKNRFLTQPIELFMRDIIRSGKVRGMLRMGILELNNRPIAATLCFEYREGMYLYNSGYSPDYRWLSAGLLSKYYSIRDSIVKRKKRYDFLKGAEKYKFHLGGKETGLFRCIINF